MPLVRIDVLDDAHSASTLSALGECVHQAMTETIDVPVDDLFQILTPHAKGQLRYDSGYLGIDRDDRVVFVSITLRSGRTDEQKKALYRRVVELITERTDVAPRNVLIALTENELCDWSFGEGIAQLAR